MWITAGFCFLFKSPPTINNEKPLILGSATLLVSLRKFRSSPVQVISDRFKGLYRYA